MKMTFKNKGSVIFLKKILKIRIDLKEKSWFIKMKEMNTKSLWNIGTTKSKSLNQASMDLKQSNKFLLI